MIASSHVRKTRQRIRARARRVPVSMYVGGSILVGYFVIALTAPWWIPYDAVATGAVPFTEPSRSHLFGTDVLGRDTFSRVMLGTREVLFLSLVGTLLSVAIGATIGLTTGYVGGWMDTLVSRTNEALISIPTLLLILLVITAAGPKLTGSTSLLIGVLVLVNAPRIARTARAAALDIRVREFVAAARLRGESVLSIVRRELAPNAAGVLLVELAVRASTAPIAIGALGFLGFGVRPPAPEWGIMISENRPAITFAPAGVIAPLVALAILVIGLNLFADGIDRMVGRSVARTP